VEPKAKQGQVAVHVPRLKQGQVVVPPHVVEAVQARVAVHVPKQGQVVAVDVSKVKDSQIGSNSR
jgi:hypothetical protein